jgi:hypothetical protein
MMDAAQDDVPHQQPLQSSTEVVQEAAIIEDQREQLDERIVDNDNVYESSYDDAGPAVEDDPAIREAVGGGAANAPILDIGSLPLPKEYSHGDGNELAYSFTLKPSTDPNSEPQRQKRPVYHSLVVYPDDAMALCMDIECDQTERYCTLSAMPSDADLGKQSFAEYFPGGATLKPFYSSIVRVCVCPFHNKMVMASLIMDAVKSTIPLPALSAAQRHRSSSPGGTCDGGAARSKDDSNPTLSGAATAPPAAASSQRRGWKVVVENGDGFVRFFHVQRTTECYCDFPVLFTT